MRLGSFGLASFTIDLREYSLVVFSLKQKFWQIFKTKQANFSSRRKPCIRYEKLCAHMKVTDSLFILPDDAGVAFIWSEAVLWEGNNRKPYDSIFCFFLRLALNWPCLLCACHLEGRLPPFGLPTCLSVDRGCSRGVFPGKCWAFFVWAGGDGAPVGIWIRNYLRAPILKHYAERFASAPKDSIPQGDPPAMAETERRRPNPDLGLVSFMNFQRYSHHAPKVSPDAYLDYKSRSTKHSGVYRYWGNPIWPAEPDPNLSILTSCNLAKYNLMESSLINLELKYGALLW